VTIFSRIHIQMKELRFVRETSPFDMLSTSRIALTPYVINMVPTHCLLICLQDLLLVHTLKQSYLIEEKMVNLRAEQLRKFEEIYAPLPSEAADVNASSVSPLTLISLHRERHEAIIKKFQDSELSYALTDIERFHVRALTETLNYVCSGYAALLYGSLQPRTALTDTTSNDVDDSMMFGAMGANILSVFRNVIISMKRPMQTSSRQLHVHGSASKVLNMLHNAELIDEYEDQSSAFVRSTFAYSGESLSEFIKGSGHTLKTQNPYRRPRGWKPPISSKKLLQQGNKRPPPPPSSSSKSRDISIHKHTSQDTQRVNEIIARVRDALSGPNVYVPESVNIVVYVVDTHKKSYNIICEFLLFI
jgi:hypothetical protein